MSHFLFVAGTLRERSSSESAELQLSYGLWGCCTALIRDNLTTYLTPDSHALVYVLKVGICADVRITSPVLPLQAMDEFRAALVHHIADGDDIWKTCIKIALGNSNGMFTLQWYWDKSQIEWSENWKYASRGIESSLALLGANRRHIMELIKQTSNVWEKSIWLKPPQRRKERITVGWIIEMQARHVVEHTKDIQAIRHAHKGETSS